MAPRKKEPDVRKTERRAKPNIRKIAQGKQPRGVEKERPRGPVCRSERLDQKALSWDKSAEQSHPYPPTTSDTLRRKQHPSASLQAKGQKRKRPQDAEESLCISANQFQKRPRKSTAADTEDQKAASGVYENKINPIYWWTRSGIWPKEYFEEGSNMSHLLARKKSTSSLRQNARYRTVLETKSSFMKESKLGITDASKSSYQTLLIAEQRVPENSLFCDDLFKAICEKMQDRNEAMVIQDITRLIVPSAENLAIYGDEHLKILIESVNEGWDNAIPVTKPRPQPDYSVGFRREAFTDDQLRRLQPFVGDLTDTSYFMATYYLYFPFLTCEVKCGAAALDIADRQNAHSATIAVRGLVELFKLVKREKDVDREILAFSISHDHTAVRIYGHYAFIEGDKTTFYRHPIRKFDFTEQDGKEKWAAASPRHQRRGADHV
ncbi:conserved hypothetical protein [Histoplasma mississippiense (nom. inval.)]|uniref:conserved hypothetical protein n=1 Tax=Ajellomyces capsulatus (strain NAm1 / WU24) TaxID=2059318 RepID=UPI000157C64B|nr:conserved hypothetical protein [Histoplasma mississippiense (nom. inval.)]EDN08099.1 conserved hypothetical protein [Histoplasma mississippiense (nom. inval.)]